MRMGRLRAAAYWAFVLVLFLGGAEMASRIDDLVHTGTALLASPDREVDLVVRDEFGPHGRPHGRYRKWRLNEYGFRGPEIPPEPVSGRTRLLVLGASEMFGLFESEGREYAAQLAKVLEARGCGAFEVVNGAMAGITVTSMKPYWERWASRAHPHVVLLYPSPMLYLNPRAGKPRTPAGPQPADRRSLLDRSRFYGRARDTVRRFEPVRRARVEYLIWTQTHGKGDDWLFPPVPEDRLALYAGELEDLIVAIRARGAEPVLLTHAVRATNPPRPDDAQDLRDMRVFFPQAAGDTLVAFEEAGARVVRELGSKHGVRVIDVAAAANGHREWFADLVHFSDEGAAALARQTAEALCPGRPT
jgi:hypothetical protein